MIDIIQLYMVQPITCVSFIRHWTCYFILMNHNHITNSTASAPVLTAFTCAFTKDTKYLSKDRYLMTGGTDSLFTNLIEQRGIKGQNWKVVLSALESLERDSTYSIDL
jgi:hypothetical protein